jgi:hypothetical protein
MAALDMFLSQLRIKIRIMGDITLMHRKTGTKIELQCCIKKSGFIRHEQLCKQPFAPDHLFSVVPNQRYGRARR